jgi:hypothetical protein
LRPGWRPAATVIAVLLALLALSAGIALWAWQELADVEMSWHGWAALGLGVGLSLVVGIGLMSLLFFSSRRGYDERAHDAEEAVGRRREPKDRH